MNKWSKVKALEDKPRSGWPLFFKCVRNVIEKAVSICVIILPRQKGQKKFDFTISKFRTQQYDDMTNKGWTPLKRKRRRTRGHGVRRICKVYSKGRSAGKLT